MRRGPLLAAALVLTGCGGGVTVPAPDVPASITVRSSAFADGAAVPREHTCQGAGRSPDLAWTGVPAGTTSLALVVSDPDAPRGTYLHWVVLGLPAGDGGLPAGGELPPGAREAENSAGRLGWTPPCPPSGTHRYVFTVYALDGPVPGDVSRDEQLDAVGRRAVATGTLTGLVSAP